MKTRIPSTVCLALSLALSAGFAAAARAEDDSDSPDSPWTAELFLGFQAAYGNSDLDIDVDPVGARATYRANDRWAFEGSFSVFDSLTFDDWQLDLSARRSIRSWDKANFFALGGLGWFEEDFSDRVRIQVFPPPDSRTSTLSAHLGLGWEIHMGERFFFRPDVRARWLEDSVDFDDFRLEGTVGFGYRF